MEHRAPCKHIFYPYTHPWPLGLGQKIKIYFAKVAMSHIIIKENSAKSTMKAHIQSLHIASTCGSGFKGMIRNSICGCVAYQIKVKGI